MGTKRLGYYVINQPAMLLSVVPGGRSGFPNVTRHSELSRTPADTLKDPIGNKFITNFMGYPVLHIYAKSLKLHILRTSMLKVCIFPKSLTTWGGIFKSINCDFFFHAYDQIDM